jgi:hypothetical protein
LGGRNKPEIGYLAKSREVLLIVFNALLLLRAVIALTEVVALAGGLTLEDVLGTLDQRVGVLGLLGVEDRLVLDLLLDELDIGVVDDDRLSVLDGLFVGQEVVLETALGNIFIGGDDFLDFGLLLLDIGLFLIVLSFLGMVLRTLLRVANVALAVSALLEVIAEGGTTSAAASLERTLLSRSVVSLIARRIVRRLVGFLVGGIAIGFAELLVLLAAVLLGGTRGLDVDGLLLVVAFVVLEHAEDIFRHYIIRNRSRRFA